MAKGKVSVVGTGPGSSKYFTRQAVEADFVIVFYNPRSKGRAELLEQTRRIILEYRSPENAVGMVRGAGRVDEQV